MSCHNNLRDEVADLDKNIYTTTHVRYNHLINTGCAIWTGKSMQNKSNPIKKPPRAVVDSEQKGGLLIQGLWTRGMEFIMDMNVVNTDESSYLHNTPQKIM